MPASPAIDTSPRLDERELRAWRGLLRVHAKLAKTLEAQLETEHALPLSSYEVLMFLSDAEGRRMRMCDLADSVILSRSGLTRLVDRLERDGFLHRESCADDARGAFAVLSDEGYAKVSAARATHLAGVRDMFLGWLSESEQDLLGDIWDRILGVEHEVGGNCPLETER